MSGVVGDSVHSESLLLIISANSYKNSSTFQSFATTFHDLRLSSMTFQTWKMVLVNFMAFCDWRDTLHHYYYYYD